MPRFTIIVLVFLGVFSVIFWIILSNSNPPNTTASSAAVAKATGTKLPAPPSTHGIGEQFSVGYWTYRVNSERWTNFIPNLGVEKANAMFLVVDISVRNDDRTASNRPVFKLVDFDGREFDEKETFMNCQLSALLTLNPTVSKRGCVVFDAPWGYYNLQLSGGYESGEKALVFIHDNINAAPQR